LALSDYTPGVRDAVEQQWHDGDLSYLWHEEQQRWDDIRRAHARRVFVVECSRRIGKSMYLCALAIQEAISGPDRQIRYAAPHAKDVKKIVLPHMRSILEDCPGELKPSFSVVDNCWTFPNGSQIHIAGCNSGNAESLRGVASHLCLVDEAGFVDELRYVVFDILLPQTLTTDGRIVLASTPAKSPAHDFAAYCAEAEASGSYVHATIYDAPHITGDLIAEYMGESGGEESSTWRREYLAQRVVDEESAVVPEFIRMRDVLVEEHERPAHYDRYVIADLGYHDLAAWLFVIWDFKRGLWIAEDELVMKNASISEQVRAAIAKEHALWGEPANDSGVGARPVNGNTAGESSVYCRLADGSPLVIAEMQRGQKYPIGQVDNGDRDAAVAAFRRVTRDAKYRINPKCKTLISHISAAVWNPQRSNFARMGSFGHFDALAAALYAERHIDRQRNPFPALDENVKHDTHFIGADYTRRKPALASLGSKWRPPR
jgi:hypothetical protein